MVVIRIGLKMTGLCEGHMCYTHIIMAANNAAQT